MIIWGFRWINKTLGKARQAYQCFVGGEFVCYIVIRHRRWFTFFFIPIFPLQSRYYIVCPQHGGSKLITSQLAMELLNGSTNGTAPLTNQQTKTPPFVENSVNSAQTAAFTPPDSEISPVRVPSPQSEVSQISQTPSPLISGLSAASPISVKPSKLSVGGILALIGMIIKSLYLVILVTTSIFMLMRVTYLGTSIIFAEMFLAFTAIISIIMAAFGWLAFALMNGKHGNGWRIYLLVYGILSCIWIFSVLKAPYVLFDAISGVLLILAFALGRTKR